MKKVAIIGAGISGLTLATYLQKQDFTLTIFDKGRGVGGRMSSRRTNWGYLDHGTQYFNIVSPEFQTFIEQYPLIIQPWPGNFAIWANGQLTEDISPKTKYVPLKAMNNLCKAIASESKLDIHLKTRIIKLEKRATWTLIDENNQQYRDFELVILTAPPAQTADLLVPHTPIAEEIRTIKMLPCYSLILIPETPVKLPSNGIQFEHPILGWLSVNESKPARENNGGLVIQSNFDWAKENLGRNREEVANILQKTVSELFQLNLARLNYQSLHLWRYALPLEANNHRYFWCPDTNLGVCGDWCLSGKVESAFLSAYSLAQKLTANQ
jgi:predicted NAD/FAD-dependent oxidoreductase